MGGPIDSSGGKRAEYIYLIREREFCRSGEMTFKIGRTAQEPSRRMAAYPKESELLIMLWAYDSVERERELLTIFRQRFTPATQYGAEYFTGDPAIMAWLIMKVCCPQVMVIT